jgi:hypothetical protein
MQQQMSKGGGLVSVFQALRGDWFGRFVHSSQHAVFRLAALAITLWLSLSVYDVLAKYGDDGLHHPFNIAATVAIATIGYFVLRGMAHRIKEKKPLAFYIALSVLYVVFEMLCNLDVSFSLHQFQTEKWMVAIHLVFVAISPFIVCVLSLFTLVLALLDADLMVERGVVLAPSASQLKQPAPVPLPGVASAHTMTLPQAVYPTLPSMGNGTSARPAQSSGGGNPGVNMNRAYQQYRNQPGQQQKQSGQPQPIAVQQGP